MKMFFTLLFIIALFSLSCTNGSIAPSGHPSKVLSVDVYNEIQPKYDDIADFEFGTAVVKKRKYGLLSYKGKEVLPCIYDSIYPLKNKTRFICLNTKIGIVDSIGSIVSECIYDGCEESIIDSMGNTISESIADGRKKNIYDRIALKRNTKWGFVNKKGEIMIQFKYDHIFSIHDSVFVGIINGKYGVADYNDNTIIDFKYDYIFYRPWENEKISWLKLNNKYGIVNSSNTIVTECLYDNLQMPNNGYVALSKGGSSIFHAGVYGIVNCETGKETIPFEYQDLGRYADGLIKAEKNGKYGYIDIDNNIVIPFIYEDAEDFSEGFALVHIDAGYNGGMYNAFHVKKSGFINKKGEVVIPFKFADQRLNYHGGIFNDGLAAMGVAKNNIYATKFGYINTKGEFIIQPIYDKAAPFDKGIAQVEVNDKIGFIDEEGHSVVQCIYDYRNYQGCGDSLICLMKNSEEFYFDYKGRPVEFKKKK